MFGATSWALKRLLKFVLKRSLKQWILTELDLEQLDVQLGQGLLELKDLVLNTDYINERLGDIPWRVEKGYVGSIQAHVPISSLYQDSCSLVADEVFLTVRPLPQPWTSSADVVSAAAEPPLPRAEWGDVVSDGVRLVASAIDHILQRLKVSVKTVVIRVALPGEEGGLLVLSLEQAAYSSQPSLAASGSPGPSLATQQTRQLSFSGLTIGARAAGDAPRSLPFLAARSGRGCRGALQLTLTEPDGGPAGVMGVDVDADLGEAVAVLDGEALRALGALAGVVSKQLQCADEAAAEPPAGVHHHWGTRSLLESLVLPDVEGLVTGVLAEAAEETEIEDADDASADDEFADASSLLESFYSASGSVYRSSSASMLAGADARPWPGARESHASEQTLSQLRELSDAMLPPSPALEWAVAIRVPSVDLCLAFADGGQAALSLGRLRACVSGRGAETSAALSIESLELTEGAAQAGRNEGGWDVWSRLPETFRSCPGYSPKGPLSATVSELSQLNGVPMSRPAASRLLPILVCRRPASEAAQPAALIYYHTAKGGSEPMMHLSLASISVWLCTEALERVQSSLLGMLDRGNHGGTVAPAEPTEGSAVASAGDRASAPGWPRLSVQIAEVCAVMPVTGGAASPHPAQDQCLVAHIAFSGSSQELWYLAVGCDDLHRPIKPELLRSLDLGSCVRVCPVTVRGAAGAWLEASTSMRLQGVTLRWMCRDRDATQRQILCLKPAQGASSLTVTVLSEWGKPEVASMPRLEEVWAVAADAPGAAPDDAAGLAAAAQALLEAESAAHAVHRLHVTGGSLVAALTPRTLGPLSEVIEGLLDLIPQPALVPETTPLNLLDVCVHARVSLRGDGDDGDSATGSVFEAETAMLRLCLVAGLGNVPGASAALVGVQGLEIREVGCATRAEGSSTLLARSGAGAHAGSCSPDSPSLVLFHASRPVDAPPSRRGRRLVFPASAALKLRIGDGALHTVDGDVRLGWIERMLGLLRPERPSEGAAGDAGRVGPESTNGSETRAPDHTGPKDASSTTISVQVHRLGLFYEPAAEAPAPTAAAALLVARGRWLSASAEQSVEVAGAQLLLAPTQTRIRDARADPLLLEGLVKQGYLVVADERALRAVLPPLGGAPPPPPHPLAEPSAAVHVINEQLRLFVSSKIVQLLQRLGRQVSPPGEDQASAPPEEQSRAPVQALAAPTPLAAAAVASFAGKELMAAVNKPAFGPAACLKKASGCGEQLFKSVRVAGGDLYESVTPEPWSPAGSPPIMLEADPGWPSATGQLPLGGEPEGDGVWLGPSKVLEDYIVPAADESRTSAGKARAPLAFEGLFHVEVNCLAAAGPRVTLLLHGLSIKARGLRLLGERDKDGARHMAFTLGTLSLNDSLGRPILFRYRASSGAPAAPPPQVFVAVRGVSATKGQELEYRVECGVQPLRLHLRRRSVDAVRAIAEDFGADGDFDEDFGARLVDWASEAGDGASEGRASSSAARAQGPPAPAWPFIQRFRLAPLLLVLDHSASAVNVRALRSGSLLELLHLVPLGGVKLTYRELSLTGVAGLPALAAAVGEAYLSATAGQAHRIVAGTQPIKPFVKAAGSAGAALRKPLSSFSKKEHRQLAWELSRSARKAGWALLNEAIVAAKAATRGGSGGGGARRRDGGASVTCARGSRSATVAATYSGARDDDDDDDPDDVAGLPGGIPPDRLLESLMEARLALDPGSDFLVL